MENLVICGLPSVGEFIESCIAAGASPVGSRCAPSGSLGRRFSRKPTAQGRQKRPLFLPRRCSITHYTCMQVVCPCRGLFGCQITVFNRSRQPQRTVSKCPSSVRGRRQRGIANGNPPILHAAGVARKAVYAAVFLAAFFLPCFRDAVIIIPAENADQSSRACRASRRAAQAPALRSRRSSD